MSNCFDPCTELSRCLFRQRSELRPSFLCGSPDLRSGRSRQYSFLDASRFSSRRIPQGFRGSLNSVQLMLQLTQLFSELPFFTFNRSENVHESPVTNLSQHGCDSPDLSHRYCIIASADRFPFSALTGKSVNALESAVDAHR